MGRISPDDIFELISEDLLSSGDKEIIRKLRTSGRNTARERIYNLLDEGTFIEFGKFVDHRSREHDMYFHSSLGDGVITGHGLIDGRKVVCFSQDFSVYQGTMGEMHAKKISKLIDFAIKAKIPIIGIWDSYGLRVNETTGSLGPSGELLEAFVACSGYIPIISIVMGSVVGTSSLSVAISDFTIQVENFGKISLNLPQEIPEIKNGEIKFDDISNSECHSEKTGLVALVADDEEDAFNLASEILSFIPDHTMAEPLKLVTSDKINRKCRIKFDDDTDQHIDMMKIILEVVDNKQIIEFFSGYAQNIIIALSRLDGQSIGIVANQSFNSNGYLDTDAAIKAARFIRFCDCFNIPIITFVDSMGFLPDVEQHNSGLITGGSKLIYAYSEASVPKLTVLIGNVFEEAYLVMCPKELGCDYNVAWPSSKLKFVINEVFNGFSTEDELIENKEKDLVLGPYELTKIGKLDDVINPNETRISLVKSLRLLQSKRELLFSKKHGNIPL